MHNWKVPLKSFFSMTKLGKPHKRFAQVRLKRLMSSSKSTGLESVDPKTDKKLVWFVTSPKPYKEEKKSKKYREEI